MGKFTVAFAITLMVSIASAEDCQVNVKASCSSNADCCEPYVCWVDGVCDLMRESLISLEGLEYVNGKAGQYERYDTCSNYLSRINGMCQTDRDCCMPLDCVNNRCQASEDLTRVIATLRGKDASHLATVG